MKSDTCQSFREFLRSDYAARRQRHPLYSIRAYAKLLHIDYSTLAKVLRGDRNFGKRSIRKLGAKLGLTEPQIQMYIDERQDDPATSDPYVKLSAAEFALLADWSYFAFLELLHLRGFKSDRAWLAVALGIPRQKVDQIIKRLTHLNMIKVAPNGRITDISGGKTTSLNGAQLSKAHSHHQLQVLKMAIAALKQTPPDLRDQSSMTMAVSKDQLNEARRRIRGFRRELASLLRKSKACDEVYQLSISLYPVTGISR